MRALLIAATLLVAAPAFADAPVSSAVHADASKAPAARTIIDGAAWRCEGATCSASGGANQPAARACQPRPQAVSPRSRFTIRSRPIIGAIVAMSGPCD